MSTIDRMVELIPPKTKIASERLVSKGHPCGYCQGNGFFWTDRFGDSVKTPCPICRGKKTVDAMITIEWKASDNL